MVFWLEDQPTWKPPSALKTICDSKIRDATNSSQCFIAEFSVKCTYLFHQRHVCQPAPVNTGQMYSPEGGAPQ